MTLIATVVLAGGESKRMGESKALLDFEGEPMLARVVRRCRAFSSEVIVVARRGQPLPAFDARVVFDPIEGEGPLVGVATGLAAVTEPVGWSFVITTDAPFVNEGVARALVGFGEGHDAAVASFHGDRHVLHAVYGPRVGEVASALVAQGVRRASRLAESVDTRWVTEQEMGADVTPEQMRAFINLNTADDLDRARRRTVS